MKCPSDKPRVKIKVKYKIVPANGEEEEEEGEEDLERFHRGRFKLNYHINSNVSM